jgi:hypothetical protein
MVEMFEDIKVVTMLLTMIVVKISLKRVEMNFCPGSKNSILGKTAKYDRIINELCHFYKKKQPSSRVEKINMLKRALISL